MDSDVVDQYDLLETLMEIEKSLPDSLKDVVFPGPFLILTAYRSPLCILSLTARPSYRSSSHTAHRA